MFPLPSLFWKNITSPVYFWDNPLLGNKKLFFPSCPRGIVETFCVILRALERIFMFLLEQLCKGTSDAARCLCACYVVSILKILSSIMHVNSLNNRDNLLGDFKCYINSMPPLKTVGHKV